MEPLGNPVLPGTPFFLGGTLAFPHTSRLFTITGTGPSGLVTRCPDGFSIHFNIVCGPCGVVKRIGSNLCGIIHFTERDGAPPASLRPPKCSNRSCGTRRGALRCHFSKRDRVPRAPLYLSTRWNKSLSTILICLRRSVLLGADDESVLSFPPPSRKSRSGKNAEAPGIFLPPEIQNLILLALADSARRRDFRADRRAYPRALKAARDADLKRLRDEEEANDIYFQGIVGKADPDIIYVGRKRLRLDDTH